MTLQEEIAKYPRNARLSVITVLDEAVEDGRIDEYGADMLLLEWDVDHFPDQMPKPICEAVKRRRARVIGSDDWDGDWDDDEDDYA